MFFIAFVKNELFCVLYFYINYLNNLTQTSNYFDVEIKITNFKVKLKKNFYLKKINIKKVLLICKLLFKFLSKKANKKCKI